MLDALIGLYRKWPLRPHCNSAAGVHAWTCAFASWVLGPQLDCRPINPAPGGGSLSTKCYHEHPDR